MDADDALAELGRRMERVLDILVEGRRSLVANEASQWKALALTRWQMLRALSAFVAEKNAVLCRFITEMPGPAADAAEALRARNRALQDAYQAFVERWALNGPRNVDAPYKVEAAAMAGRIEREVIADVQALEQVVRLGAA